MLEQERGKSGEKKEREEKNSNRANLNSNKSKKKGKRLKHPLDHPKKALVFTQIYLAPEPITAKKISENTGLALNTVYYYIRELSEEHIIQSQTENVGNLIQERWIINIEYDKERRSQIRSVMNKKYEDHFLIDPKDLGRQLMMFNSIATPYLKTYKRKKEKFVKLQEHSSRPAIIKLWTLFPDEFEYVVKEIEKIRKKLHELYKVSRNQQKTPSNHLTLKMENNLVFMVAFPTFIKDEEH